jgi:hypothetical protein
MLSKVALALSSKKKFMLRVSGYKISLYGQNNYRIADPDPGSSAFYTPGSGIRIRDMDLGGPVWKNPDPG